MNQKIRAVCETLQKEEGIKILFAVENGSRAWRMESKDSDYDVRFVFVRLAHDYIRIHRPADVITAAFDEAGNPCAVQGSLIDVCGFDVFKFAKLLSSSNPAAIEWLMSDIVYYGTQNEVFKSFAVRNFSATSLYHHYKSMCKNNYDKYIANGSLVTYKKYLYVYRGLINATWVVHKKTVPPIIFSDALLGVKQLLPEAVIERLYQIIELKSEGREKDLVQPIEIMDRHIERFLKSEPETLNRHSQVPLQELNTELRKIVLG